MKIKIDIKPIAIILIVIGFLFVLKFQFPFFKIETNSMKNSFLPGQIVVVSKWSKIKHNDVVVYVYKNKFNISKVIAMAGDTILCSDGKLKLNNNFLESGNEVFEFLILCKPSVNDSLVDSFEEIYPKREYRAIITQTKADSLKKKEKVIKVKKVIQQEEYILFENKGQINNYRNRDNFGPILVPENSVWLMNDNRTNVNDSRSFGIVDENEIIGVITYSFN